MKIRSLLWLPLALLGVASVLCALGYIDLGFGVTGMSLAVQTVVTGVRATAGSVSIESNSRVIDMSDTIHLLDPNMAPLTAITMKLRKVQCISPKIEWLEDDYLPSSDLINGTVNAGSTTITMDNGGYFRAGDVLKVLDTGEVIHVLSVASNVLTVTRSVGATAAAQLDDNETLLIIGNANNEGATGRTVKTTQKTPQFNYTQIFRWPYANTRTLQNSELYGGSDLDYQAKKAGLEHRIQVERAYMFGEKNEDTSGTAALRHCDGVIARISTNIQTTQTLTSATLETFLRTAFRFGPATKILFASRNIISYINQIASNLIQTIPASTSFPLSLTEYVSGHGKLYLVTHNQLEGSGANNTSYGGWALALDMDSIFHRYLKDSDTQIRTNIQANDEDGRRDEYLSECCPMVIQEKNHSVLRGVTGAA